MTSKLICATELPDLITVDLLQRVYTATLETISWQPKGNISLAFVGESQIRIYNKQFANNDYPTDVLSFLYSEDAVDTEEIMGEIVICIDIAHAQALEYKTDIVSEVALLLAHGLIHLSGKDHQTTSSQASFDATQSAIMKSLMLNYRTMPW